MEEADWQSPVRMSPSPMMITSPTKSRGSPCSKPRQGAKDLKPLISTSHAISPTALRFKTTDWKGGRGGGGGVLYLDTSLLISLRFLFSSNSNVHSRNGHSCQHNHGNPEHIPSPIPNPLAMKLLSPKERSEEKLKTVHSYSDLAPDFPHYSLSPSALYIAPDVPTPILCAPYLRHRRTAALGPSLWTSL
eukprot:768802-Hanusia_phi.AAC.9